MPFVTANGIKMYYERTGGNKPPLMLLHGATDNGHCWPRVIEALKKDYDVITLDARGHGRSDAPAGSYATEVLAADVAGVIQTLGLKKPAVMGHSMGAATAAVLGAHHPDLVGCLVLEDPPWRLRTAPPEKMAAAMQAWAASLKAMKSMSDLEMIAANRRGNPQAALWDETELQPWCESKREASPIVVSGLDRAMMSYRIIVPKLACPTLLITGDPKLGSIVTPYVAKRAAGMNANIQVVHFDGAGHNIRREKFEGYIDAVKVFLKGAAR
jgi:N-formylmaleamate deformylase